MDKNFEVRDMRVKEKFFMNDEYLNGYAKLCGWKATLVYMCLCRHADRHQEAFPSVETMAKNLGISERTVNRAIADLTAWNIIGVSQRKSDTGTFFRNLYALKDKKEWKEKPHATQSLGNRTTNGQSPDATQSKNRTPVSRYKDTQLEGGTKEGSVADAPRIILSKENEDSEREVEPRIIPLPYSPQTTREAWESGERWLQVLSWFFTEKGLWAKAETKYKLQALMARHKKAAKRIARADWKKSELKTAQSKALFSPEMEDEWTLETIEKYLTK